MSIHGHEAGGMGPWSHRTLFQLAPAHFPHPLPKPPHGATVLCMVAARPMREATESGGCFCIPSAPAARPLGNVRSPATWGVPTLQSQGPNRTNSSWLDIKCSRFSSNRWSDHVITAVYCAQEETEGQ